MSCYKTYLYLSNYCVYNLLINDCFPLLYKKIEHGDHSFPQFKVMSSGCFPDPTLSSLCLTALLIKQIVN